MFVVFVAITLEMMFFTLRAHGVEFEDALERDIRESSISSVEALNSSYAVIPSSTSTVSAEQTLASLSDMGFGDNVYEIFGRVWAEERSSITPPLYDEWELEPMDFDICGIPARFESIRHDWKASAYTSAASCLPEAMLKSLAEAGWSIHITPIPIDKVFPVSAFKDVDNIAGICWIPTKEIWIDAECYPSSVLVHEIGHAVDWECGGASLDDEWRKAFASCETVSRENKAIHDTWDSTFFGTIETTNVCNHICSRGRFFEQYANAFEMYWTQPARLLYECPEMYSYFAERFGISEEMSQEDMIANTYVQGRLAHENPMTLEINDVMEETDAFDSVEWSQIKEENLAWLMAFLKTLDVPLYDPNEY